MIGPGVGIRIVVHRLPVVVQVSPELDVREDGISQNAVTGTRPNQDPVGAVEGDGVSRPDGRAADGVPGCGKVNPPPVTEVAEVLLPPDIGADEVALYQVSRPAGVITADED